LHDSAKPGISGVLNRTLATTGQRSMKPMKQGLSRENDDEYDP
jgi:hypothetical protein